MSPHRTSRAPPPHTAGVSRRALIGGALSGSVPAPVSPPGSAAVSDTAPSDADLLAGCEAVHRLEAKDWPSTGGPERWDAIVRHVAELPARTGAGLQAKARLVLAIMPLGPDGGTRTTASPDELLLLSLLRDVLGRADDVT